MSGIDRVTGEPATAYTPPEDAEPVEADADDVEAPDAWRDRNGEVWMNLRKREDLSGVYDAEPSAEPLWLRDADWLTDLLARERAKAWDEAEEAFRRRAADPQRVPYPRNPHHRTTPEGER